MAVTSKQDSKITSLTPETREVLLHSVLHYLNRGGFTKTLKRFLSEAQIQDDTWKASSVNLEDIYCKYIKDSCQSKDDAVVESETKAKKKKKNKHDSASGDEVKETKSEAVKMSVDDSVIDLEVNESKKKPKDKKNKQHELASGDEVKETKSEAVKKSVDDSVINLEVNESKKKPKDKKKNKHELASGDEVKETKSEAVKEPVDDNVNDLEVEESKKKPKDKKKKSEEQDAVVDLSEVKEDKKSSKKRKRLSNENGHGSDKIETNQTIEEAAKENGIDEQNTHKNEKPEMNGGEKSGPQKSSKKQRTGSAEPKTVNAFQRVKIDEVEFAHEKLQDNSYWAKDGADIGYGAKAQEVLGQVKGRGFRHEKTKKKRGSYRGGQIDLQSHSIKFNYDDEE